MRTTRFAILPLLFAAGALPGIGCGVRGEPGTPTPTARVVVAPVEAFRRPVRAQVRPGDTLESVSKRMAGRDWHLWCQALSAELDPKRLLPGLSFEGLCSVGGPLQEVHLDLDRRRELHLFRDGDGIRVDRVERPIESEVVRVVGTVESSLFAALDAAGEAPDLAVRIAQIFRWDIDFFRDLRRGDSFVVVVDRQEVEGEPFGYGNIFAARFLNADRVLDAILYPDDDGRLGYYDLEGNPLRKQFQRSPLEFSRVTSSFSMSRFHPVLKRRMPHYGVDYGAPVGTPVHVTADGTVTYVGRNGGAGNMVTVRHANGFETSYLHLSRYASGMRRGVRVQQNQVVGFVGQTGWATGPHLDYRVKQNGRWINPTRIASPAVEPLQAERLPRFLSHALAVLSLLEGREPPRGASC